MRGVMEKCTYCVQRIQEAKIEGKSKGKRWPTRRRCRARLPADVPGRCNRLRQRQRSRQPGSEAEADLRNYAMLAELNTKPRTTYLAKLRNPNPELEVRS